MEVVILNSTDAVADRCASIISDLVHRRPNCVLGLATGDTPRATYRRLVELSNRDVLDMREVNAVALDEYVGLASDDPRSYRAYLKRELADPLGLDSRAVHVPDVGSDDLQRSCAEFEALLERLGGVDLQLLGIGTDGHIGFNEPGSSLASRTRIKTLHPRTVADNARFFPGGSDVPRHVVTQGVATILSARHVVLIATGDNKAAAVAAAIEGPVSAILPASALQLHPHATAILDEPAASHLRLADYYRGVQEHKPPWQGH